MTQTKHEVLLQVQAAQHLGSEDPERAELLLRSALKAAEALGHSSPTLHLQLAELLHRLRKTRQALEEVTEALELDPFNLAALNLHRILRTLRGGSPLHRAEHRSRSAKAQSKEEQAGASGTAQGPG